MELHKTGATWQNWLAQEVSFFMQFSGREIIFIGNHAHVNEALNSSGWSVLFEMHPFLYQ